MHATKQDSCKFCNNIKLIAAKGLCRACYSRLQKTGTLEYQRKGKRSICMIEECDSNVVSGGLCDKHRKRLANNGHVINTRPGDWGKRENHPLYGTWANLRRYRGVQLCKGWHENFWLFVKECPEKPEERSLLRPASEGSIIDKDNCKWVVPASRMTPNEKEYIKNWARLDREVNPDKYREKYLLKSYGITLKDFQEMQKKQGFVCAICKNPEVALNPHKGIVREMAVDHCHTTGKVRGLLCSKCNTAIGNFKDDVSLLRQAIVYLGSY